MILAGKLETNPTTSSTPSTELAGKTNEQVTAQVARITHKLLERTAKLDLADKPNGVTGDQQVSLPGTVEQPGMSLTVNTGPESTGIAVTKSNETDNQTTVSSVELPITSDQITNATGYKVSQEQIGMTKSLNGENIPTVLATASLEASRNEGKYGPMTVETTQESAGGSVAVSAQYGAENRPATPGTISAAADVLSQVRGGIAEAELAQQQAPQAQTSPEVK